VVRGAALAFVDDDGLGEAILGAHAVAAPEELQEAKATFEYGGTVAQSSLDGLPEAEAWSSERNSTGAGDEFAWRAAVADEVGEAEVEEEEDEVAGLVKIPDEVDVLLVKNLEAPEGFAGRPEDDDDEDVDDIAEEALPEGGEGEAVELLQAGGVVGVEEARGGAEFGLGGWHGVCERG
jgi:hypothetical protein